MLKNGNVADIVIACLPISLYPEAYSEPCQTSKAEFSDSLKLLTIFVQLSTLDV